MPSRTISFFVGQLHLPFGFETETAQIGRQMPEDLELIRDRKTIELQHDRRIERGDVAVPDVALDTSESAHADVIELREKEGIDEVAAIDLELWIIDGFLGDLQARRTRAEESAAPPPIQLHFGFAGPRHQIGEIKSEKIVPLDYVRIALLNNCRELFERVVFGFLDILGVNHNQLLPSAIV